MGNFERILAWIAIILFMVATILFLLGINRASVALSLQAQTPERQVERSRQEGKTTKHKPTIELEMELPVSPKNIVKPPS